MNLNWLKQRLNVMELLTLESDGVYRTPTGLCGIRFVRKSGWDEKHVWFDFVPNPTTMQTLRVKWELAVDIAVIDASTAGICLAMGYATSLTEDQAAKWNSLVVTYREENPDEPLPGDEPTESLNMSDLPTEDSPVVNPIDPNATETQQTEPAPSGEEAKVEVATTTSTTTESAEPKQTTKSKRAKADK